MIIDPKVGYPALTNVLAAIVWADDCITADAYATAMAIQGFSFTQDLLEKQKDIQAFLVYQDEAGAIAFMLLQACLCSSILLRKISI